MHDAENMPMVVVGNKADLNDMREVSPAEGKDLALSFRASFIEGIHSFFPSSPSLILCFIFIFFFVPLYLLLFFVLLYLYLVLRIAAFLLLPLLYFLILLLFFIFLLFILMIFIVQPRPRQGRTLMRSSRLWLGVLGRNVVLLLLTIMILKNTWRRPLSLSNMPRNVLLCNSSSPLLYHTCPCCFIYCCLR